MNDGVHRERVIGDENCRTAIIMTHGIMGSPTTLAPLIEETGQGFRIENLLLPGHGGSAADFARSGMREWQRYLDDRVAAASARHERVILVGHSMGCLLSVRSALSYPDRVVGLFLLAAPLRMRPLARYIQNCLCSGLALCGQDPGVAAASAATSVSDRNPLAYIPTAPRYIELFRKADETRGLLDRLDVPVRAVISLRDEIVSPRSAEELRRIPGADVLLLRESGHFLYTDGELPLIRRSFRRLLDTRG